MARKLIEKTIKQYEKETHCLRIYRNKHSLYGQVIDMQTKEVIMAASFKDKDGDATIYRVKEYFNF